MLGGGAGQLPTLSGCAGRSGREALCRIVLLRYPVSACLPAVVLHTACSSLRAVLQGSSHVTDYRVFPCQHDYPPSLKLCIAPLYLYCRAPRSTQTTGCSPTSMTTRPPSSTSRTRGGAPRPREPLGRLGDDIHSRSAHGRHSWCEPVDAPAPTHACAYGEELTPKRILLLHICQSVSICCHTPTSQAAIQSKGASMHAAMRQDCCGSHACLGRGLKKLLMR